MRSPTIRPGLPLGSALLLLTVACSGEATLASTAPPATGEATPASTARPAAGEGAATSAPTGAAGAATSGAPGAEPTLLCARAVVVAWAGADHASPTVTRSRDEARARADALLGRLRAGEDFAALARAESDARSSGPRGGLLGTYAPEDWPAAHAAIRPAIEALSIGATSEVLEAPYGWVVARRCPVELVHTRHVLVRFAGARNAPEELTRTRDEARAAIDGIRAELAAPGADFAAIARARSEDASAERGGDVGTLGRGRLAPEYEAAAFALAEHAVSDVVETDVGFHVIQRLPL